MILKLVLNFFLIFYLSSCGQFKESIEVQLGDTIKVSSTYFDKGNKGLVYAWGPPKSKNGNIPEFEIEDNHLYFTPEEEGEYTIELSVETLGGEMIIEETFSYKSVFQTSPLKKTEQKSSPKPSNNKTNEFIGTYYTVQVCAKTIKEEADLEFSKLQDMGYNDIYMEEFTLNNLLYWRVRAGKFNSMKKAEKRRDEIADILRISSKDLWALKVN